MRGREASSASAVEIEIAGAAVIFCNQVAPAAPEAILRESSIRLGGWLYGNRPHVSEHTVKDQSGTEISLRFNNAAATANGWRASGASALLSRFVVRRCGVTDASSERVTGAATAVPAPGPAIMRFAFSDALPFTDDDFRWLGTINSVEIDAQWSQPAAFGFWIGGPLSLVVGFVQLIAAPGTVTLQTSSRRNRIGLGTPTVSSARPRCHSSAISTNRTPFAPS